MNRSACAGASLHTWPAQRRMAHSGVLDRRQIRRIRRQVDAELVKIVEKIKEAASQPMPPTQQVSRGSPPQQIPGRLCIAGQPFEPEMIFIPEGEFLMGSDPEHAKAAQDGEEPQHRLYWPDYYLAKAPVTNAQYMAFVRETSDKPPSYWTEGRPPRRSHHACRHFLGHRRLW